MCEEYKHLSDDYPYCDPPYSHDPWSVDLGKVLGPSCLSTTEPEEPTANGCCYLPLGYDGGPAFGSPCAEACAKAGRTGKDEAYCERSGKGQPYGNCFCGPATRWVSG